MGGNSRSLPLLSGGTSGFEEGKQVAAYFAVDSVIPVKRPVYDRGPDLQHQMGAPAGESGERTNIKRRRNAVGNKAGRVEEGGAVPREQSVSPPRSSNRTCGYPASGFPTGFIAGIRRAVTRAYSMLRAALASRYSLLGKLPVTCGA